MYEYDEVRKITRVVDNGTDITFCFGDGGEYIAVARNQEAKSLKVNDKIYVLFDIMENGKAKFKIESSEVQSVMELGDIINGNIAALLMMMSNFV